VIRVTLLFLSPPDYLSYIGSTIALNPQRQLTSDRYTQAKNEQSLMRLRHLIAKFRHLEEFKTNTPNIFWHLTGY